MRLMKKRIAPESMEILYDRPFTPESFAQDFEVRDGNWFVQDGFLIGENRQNSAAMALLRRSFYGPVCLDFYGKVPASLVKADPNYATCFITNLGSIKLKSGYHHLSNWGTNSVFVIIGEKKLSPFYDKDGNVTMKETIDLGLTIDERIADGFYYSKTIKLLKHLLQHPELLELPANQEVEYE